VITTWIVQALGWLWSQVLASFPTVTVPGWLASAPGVTDALVDRLGGLGAWFPFSVLGAVLGSAVLIAGVALTIRVVRIVASFLTLGGGA
jgi:hypothetical protein